MLFSLRRPRISFGESSEHKQLNCFDCRNSSGNNNINININNNNNNNDNNDNNNINNYNGSINIDIKRFNSHWCNFFLLIINVNIDIENDNNINNINNNNNINDNNNENDNNTKLDFNGSKYDVDDDDFKDDDFFRLFFNLVDTALGACLYSIWASFANGFFDRKNFLNADHNVYESVKQSVSNAIEWTRDHASVLFNLLLFLFCYCYLKVPGKTPEKI